VLLAAIEASLAGVGIHRKGEDRVLVACSGGADSIALAHGTAELLGARRVILGHVDHQVRAGSGEDAAFVARFAEELGTESAITVVDPGPDDEARLRSARYAALEDQREKTGARFILTAHSRDDQAETVLLAIVRTAELSALRGIARQHGHVLRPLLGVSRAELRRYASERRLAWREDPTNLEPRWLRNRIRKELLPLLDRAYRSGIAARLASLADEVVAILAERSPRSEAEKISEAPSSNRPARREVLRWEAPAIHIERRLWSGGQLPDGKDSAVFDAALLDRPVLRAARPGDRIQPFGMRGTKKLQDVLVDAKVPRDQRTWVWVVTSPDGEVVWVPRLVRSARAPVCEETREVWIFTCVDATLEDGS
jgi:tRNA(Ile)-lysidine synthase